MGGKDLQRLEGYDISLYSAYYLTHKQSCLIKIALALFKGGFNAERESLEPI